jgi:hypothetical protein
MIRSRFTVTNRTDIPVGNGRSRVLNNRVSRYFFNIVHSDFSRVPDDEGCEFESYMAAKQEAVDSVRDLVCDAFRRGENAVGLAIEITDESGEVLDTIRARLTFG